jgi:phosphate-selective porin OprO/OprP
VTIVKKGVTQRPSTRIPIERLEKAMNKLGRATWAATTFLATTATGLAPAQSADDTKAEIAALKRQLLAMEQKLEKLQRQTAANTNPPAKAAAKADAKVSVANANATIPVKSPVTPTGAVVKMPDNRPTICTADELNCVAITSRLQFDAARYDYRPNSASTDPQQTQNGVNARRSWAIGTMA